MKRISGSLPSGLISTLVVNSLVPEYLVFIFCSIFSGVLTSHDTAVNFWLDVPLQSSVFSLMASEELTDLEVSSVSFVRTDRVEELAYSNAMLHGTPLLLPDPLPAALSWDGYISRGEVTAAFAL